VRSSYTLTPSPLYIYMCITVSVSNCLFGPPRLQSHDSRGFIVTLSLLSLRPPTFSPPSSSEVRSDVSVSLSRAWLSFVPLHTPSYSLYIIRVRHAILCNPDDHAASTRSLWPLCSAGVRPHRTSPHHERRIITVVVWFIGVGIGLSFKYIQ